jgi:hypothetical protein
MFSPSKTRLAALAPIITSLFTGNALAQRLGERPTTDQSPFRSGTILQSPTDLGIGGVYGGTGGLPGGGDNGGESVLGRVYVIIVCTDKNDISPDCQRGVEQATETLTEALAEDNASKISERVLSVSFPNMLDGARQTKFLFDLENAAISAVQLKLDLQLKAVAPFQIQQLSPAAAQLAVAQHVIALNRMNQQAREQANNHVNWSQNTQPNTYTFQFRSNAYNQAVQINRSGWGSN